MKNLVLSCLAVVALVSMVGCADDKPATTTDSSATMSSDTKDMTPVHHHHHHDADAAAPAPAQ